jgi:hypothetical protein
MGLSFLLTGSPAITYAFILWSHKTLDVLYMATDLPTNSDLAWELDDFTQA